MGPKSYVVLLNYRGWEDTVQCLESVLKSGYDNYQVIVCDNFSGNGSMERIIEWAEGKRAVQGEIPKELESLVKPFAPKPAPYVLYDRMTAEKGGDPIREKKTMAGENGRYPMIFIETGKNLGFAGGNNVAIRYAMAKNDFEYLWLLNNDTVVPRDSLTRLVEKGEREKNTRTGLIGSKIMHFYRPELIQGVGGLYNPLLAANGKKGFNEPDQGQYDSEDLRFDYVIGASLFVTRGFLGTVGLMSEDYFLYYEELDWQKRAERTGWKSGYCPASIVFHKEGGTIGTNRNGVQRSELADYYQLRNRVLFTKKYYPLFLAPIVLSFAAVLVNRVVRGQWNRIPVVIKALFSLPLSKETNR